MTIHVAWPRVAPRCGTRVTSVQAVKRANALGLLRASAGMLYVGMPGKPATAHGIETDGYFGKPWACLNDPRGWRFAYAAYLKGRLLRDPKFRSAVQSLHGLTLVCWCKQSSHGVDPDCHADLLARYAEWLHHDEAQCLAALERSAA